jgi:hypothetical protein
MTSGFVNVIIVNVVGTGIVVAVDDTMIVSRVVIGTIAVWVVVPSENDVALLKDAVVFNGCDVQKDTLGTLVGRCCNGGFPAVSTVVCSVYTGCQPFCY